MERIDNKQWEVAMADVVVRGRACHSVKKVRVWYLHAD